MAETGQLIYRRFHVLIGNKQHVDLVAQFDGLDVRAFFVEQKRGDGYRNLNMYCAGVFLHRLLFEDPQYVQCGRLDAPDMPGTGAARAGDVAGFGQRRAQPLS